MVIAQHRKSTHKWRTIRRKANFMSGACARQKSKEALFESQARARPGQLAARNAASGIACAATREAGKRRMAFPVSRQERECGAGCIPTME